jgi:hypothetical protein
MDMLRDFASGAYLSETQNPIPPPPHLAQCTLYTYIGIVYLFTQGRPERGGGVEPERGNSSQSWVENTNMTDCNSSL